MKKTKRKRKRRSKRTRKRRGGVAPLQNQPPGHGGLDLNDMRNSVNVLWDKMVEVIAVINRCHPDECRRHNDLHPPPFPQWLEQI